MVSRFQLVREERDFLLPAMKHFEAVSAPKARWCLPYRTIQLKVPGIGKRQEIWIVELNASPKFAYIQADSRKEIEMYLFIASQQSFFEIARQTSQYYLRSGISAWTSLGMIDLAQKLNSAFAQSELLARRSVFFHV